MEKKTLRPKSKDVTLVVTPEDYDREIRSGIKPDETFKPGTHKGRRGGFLERHGLTPEQVRAMFKESPPALPAPPGPVSPERIVQIREGLDYSQSMFARLLGVSPRTIQDWEQGRRVPNDAALKLLAVAAKNPEVLLDV